MEKRSVKFGVFADLHVDIMHDTQARLEAFLDACRKADVDFIIQLGDFCYPEERHVICRPENMPENIRNALAYPTYADKDAIIALFRNFEKPGYHVLGNHDCDMCSKRAVLDYYGVDYGPYYSFDFGGFHFVVLDPNYYYWDGQYVSYENGNYFDASYEKIPVLPYLPPEQLQWLEEDLAKTPYPSVLFSHQRLTAGKPSIRNAEELRAVLRNAPNGVVLALNGHEHIDNVEKVDNTWFWNVNSISNYWLGGRFACMERYSAEIDEKYPNIRYVAPYEAPAFAIVTMDETGASVAGTRSSIVGPKPEEQGVYETGTGFDRLAYGAITASIADRRLPF